MNKRKIGQEYEQKAARFLEQRGMHILEMNFQNRSGEIDIIAKDGDYYCFVEVKYRSSNRFGSPLEAVDYKKQQQIRKVALYYMKQHGLGDFTPCRFDVIAFCGEEMNYIENGF